MISIVIPTFNESKTIGFALNNLLNIISPDYEIIVVDGSSVDDTREIVRSFDKVKLIHSKKGRAIQMNIGAVNATKEYVLFHHADVLLNSTNFESLSKEIISKRIDWGWFEIRINNPRFIYRIIETFSNLRVFLTGSPLGDHAIFVRRDVFQKVGGYPEIPLMEDIAFVNRVKGISKGVRIKKTILISARRFEYSGILNTIFKMWTLRILYNLGVSTDKLAQYYGDSR